jgi:hypothetical protein
VRSNFRQLPRYTSVVLSLMKFAYKVVVSKVLALSTEFRFADLKI